MYWKDKLSHSIVFRWGVSLAPLWLIRVHTGNNFTSNIKAPTTLRGCFEKRHCALTTQQKCCLHAWKWMNCFSKYYYNDHLRQKTQCIQVIRKALLIREFEKICIQNEVKFELKSHLEFFFSLENLLRPEWTVHLTYENLFNEVMDVAWLFLVLLVTEIQSKTNRKLKRMLRI